MFAILDYMGWILYLYCCVLLFDHINVRLYQCMYTVYTSVSPIHPKSTCGGFLRHGDPSVTMVVSRLKRTNFG